jgi:hypothetical protein
LLLTGAKIKKTYLTAYTTYSRKKTYGRVAIARTNHDTGSLDAL